MKHYLHQKHKRQTEKPALANKVNYALVWYTFYDVQPGNRAGPTLTTPQLIRGNVKPWLHVKQNYFEIISVFYFTCNCCWWLRV